MLETPQPQKKKKSASAPAATHSAPRPASFTKLPPRAGVPQAAPLKPGAKAAPAARATQKAAPPAPNRTPAIARGLQGFFKREFAAITKAGNGALTGIRDRAQKLTTRAQDLAKNPGKALATVAAVPSRAWNTVKAAPGRALAFAGQKVNQFKKWYATPEGKAKFWKGVTLTAVGLATVASGGALTAPALALAAGVSAAGGVAAKVVENKVYNAAAKTKAARGKGYKPKYRGTFEGVSAKSVAIDAVVGGVGGPVMKFAGKALVGSAVALGKGVLPAARGLGRLALGAGGGVGKRLLPSGAKAALRGAGAFVKQHAGTAVGVTRNYALDPAAKVGRAVAGGAKKLGGGTVGLARNAGKAALKVTSKPRKWVADGLKATRKLDRRGLGYLKAAARKSPVVKALKGVRNTVDGAGLKVSKRLVKGKVAVADGLDALKAGVVGKLSQSAPARSGRELSKKLTKHLEGIDSKTPIGKAVTEFRASGTAIRTHLTKVWGEASKDLNKDLSRLLGRHGSVQADFKALAEKGGKELYEQEIGVAKAAATERMRQKVQKDFEHVLLQEQAASGARIDMEAIRALAARRTSDAVDKAAEQLQREAETFVARHPSTLLEQAAMNAHAAEGVQKAAEKFFGKNADKKGLLERSGMALTAPVRAPLEERLEKLGKLVEAFRSSTPATSVALVGSETMIEAAEKTATSLLEAPLKDRAKEWKGEAKKAPKDESVVLTTVQDVLDTFGLAGLDKTTEDMIKNMNMKEED